MGPREAWRVGALHDPEIWSDQAGGDWPVVKVPAQSQNRLATAVGTRVLDGSTGGASTPLVEPEARPRARRSKSSNNTSAVGGIAPRQSNIPRDQDAAGVVFLSTEGKIEFASRAAAELLGRALPDLVDRDLSTSIHPEDKQRVADLLSALVAEPGVTATMGFRCRNADGSWRWLGCAATNQLERPGIHAVIAHVWDRGASVAIAPSFDLLENQSRVLIENAAHFTAIVDRDGVIGYVSPAVEGMLGYLPESLEGVHISALLHPQDAPAVLKGLDYRVEHPGRGRLIQFRSLHKDGSWRVLEAIASNRLDDPAVAGMVIDARDVTERKWSAERLQHSLDALLAIHDVGRLLGSTLEQHAIGTALLDGAHRLAPIEAAALLLRTTRSSLHRSQTLGSPLSEAARRSRPARAARQLVLTTGTPQFFRSSPRKNGVQPSEACSLPLRVQDRVIGILEVYGRGPAESWPIDELGILADQAASALERTRLYLALSERERRLEHLVRQLLLAQEEERRRVAYEVHDGLAQLAAAAQQHLEAFASRYHSRSHEREDELRVAVDLAGRTVREARRVIAGLRPSVLDDFGLAPAISYELQGLRGEGWHIEYTDLLGPVRLDPVLETALFRVLQEALANVRKHAKSLRVAVTLERRGRSVRLEIRDWGRGFRPSAVRGRAGPSERVGLAGMQERIALLRGRCTIHSRPGAGARINVEVPLREARGKA